MSDQLIGRERLGLPSGFTERNFFVASNGTDTATVRCTVFLALGVATWTLIVSFSAEIVSVIVPVRAPSRAPFFLWIFRTS